MQSLRQIINEAIYCYITEIQEIDVDFPICENTDFTNYLSLDRAESYDSAYGSALSPKDLFEYAIDILFCEDFYCRNHFDWKTVSDLLKELHEYNIVTDKDIVRIKECWDNAQEMLERNRHFYEKQKIDYDDVVEDLQTKVNNLYVDFVSGDCGETMSQFQSLITHAENAKNMELMTKLKEISDHVISVCQQEGFTTLLCGISSLHVTHKYNKLLEITTKTEMTERLYEVKDMDAKNITDIIMQYSKTY